MVFRNLLRMGWQGLVIVYLFFNMSIRHEKTNQNPKVEGLPIIGNVLLRVLVFVLYSLFAVFVVPL